MPWSSPWGSWLAWTLAFAVAIWLVHVLLALVEEPLTHRGLAAVGQWARFVIPLILAFFIGVALRSWAWVLGPPVAILLTMLTYPLLDFLSRSPARRQQIGSGLIVAVFAVSVDALFAALAAVAGVACGKWFLGK